MTRSIAAAVAALAMCGLAGPVGAAPAPKVNEVQHRAALNTLSDYLARHGYAGIERVERRDDVIRAAATRNGQPVTLSVDVATQTLREEQG